MKNHSLNFLDLVNESLKEIGECDISKLKICKSRMKLFI